MKKNNLIVGIVVLVLVVAGIFVASNNGNYSVLGGASFEPLPGEISCNTNQACYDSLISLGFPSSELDLQLQDYYLVCQNNVCGAIAK